MDQKNPNDYEAAITNINKLYEELKQRTDQALADLRAGRVIGYYAQTEFVRLSRDIGYDMSLLARPIDDPTAIEPAEPAEPVDPKPYVPRFQQFVNDVLQQFIVDKNLDPALLEGETTNYEFTYREVEKVYRSGSRDVLIPKALIKLTEGWGENICDRIIRLLDENGDTYDTFNPETDDGDILDSEVEYEERD